jgi:hypothetical protein
LFELEWSVSNSKFEFGMLGGMNEKYRIPSASWQWRQRQRNQCQWDSSQQGFELHPTRLSPHLRQFRWVIYLLCLIAQLARTSRGQTYSSLISLLKETRRRAPEHGQEHKSPPTIRADSNECC